MLFSYSKIVYSCHVGVGAVVYHVRAGLSIRILPNDPTLVGSRIMETKNDSSTVKSIPQRSSKSMAEIIKSVFARQGELSIASPGNENFQKVSSGNENSQETSSGNDNFQKASSGNENSQETSSGNDNFQKASYGNENFQ